jgi:hypothetical protein
MIFRQLLDGLTMLGPRGIPANFPREKRGSCASSPNFITPIERLQSLGKTIAPTMKRKEGPAIPAIDYAHQHAALADEICRVPGRGDSEAFPNDLLA